MDHTQAYFHCFTKTHAHVHLCRCQQACIEQLAKHTLTVCPCEDEGRTMQRKDGGSNAALPDSKSCANARVIVRGWVGRRPRLCSASRAPQVYLHPESLPVPLACRGMLGRAGASTTVSARMTIALGAYRVSVRVSVSCSLCAAAGRETRDG